ARAPRGRLGGRRALRARPSDGGRARAPGRGGVAAPGRARAAQLRLRAVANAVTAGDVGPALLDDVLTREAARAIALGVPGGRVAATAAVHTAFDLVRIGANRRRLRV